MRREPNEILRAAGFSGIRHTAFDITADLPDDSVIDDEQLAFMGVGDDDLPAARNAIEEHLAQFKITPDLNRFPLSFQIFEAVRVA